MSDEFRRCERDFKWKVQLSHPDLSYAAKQQKKIPTLVWKHRILY